MMLSRRRAVAMLLSLFAAAVVFTAGLTLLSAASTSNSLMRVMSDHAQARQAAESAAATVVGYIEQHADWREHVPHDGWVEEISVGGAMVEIEVGFEPSLADAVVGVALSEPSMEGVFGSLANPLLGPPMSGTFGPWRLERTALVETGLTVPHVGFASSVAASDGARLAYMTFGVSVTGSATLSQDLGVTLEPNSVYRLRVDAGTAGLATVLAAMTLEVRAGGVLVASSGSGSVLTVLDLGSGLDEYSIVFESGHTPPGGTVKVAVKAASVLGVLSGVGIDHIRLERESDAPTVLTVSAQSRFGEGGHRLGVTANVEHEADGTPRVSVVNWSEH